MASSAEADGGDAGPIQIKTEPGSGDAVGDRILAICAEFPQGVSDKILQATLPDIDPKSRAVAINSLLNLGKIDLFKSAEKGLLYRCKQGDTKGTVIKGDTEEKVVYKIIEEAGNKGTWIRDIRVKSNLGQAQLTKVLKSLKQKKLVKEVKSVNSTRKIVYMLFTLEPDRSVTGGAWYSDQDFESEFVEILNQQCYRFLYQKLEKARESSDGPLSVKNISLASSKEVLKYISELGISKVQLRVEDIEAILDTLVFDGKVERSVAVVSSDGSGGETRFYRAVESLLPTTGLMRMPCGGCPVVKDCSESIGAVNPTKCTYIREWFSM
jgi:DNA-directed RNA polymerase III subunit RPC6